VLQPSDGFVTFQGFYGSYDWSYVDAAGVTQRGVSHFGRGRRRRAAVLLGAAARRTGAALGGPQQEAAVDWPK
jgi:hypothetical protein